MSLTEDAFSSLVPEQQPSWGRSLDPAEWLSSFTSAGYAASPSAPSIAPAAPARAAEPELSQLVEGWVRRIALGGDQRRGVARLDIGYGCYAGAELIVTAGVGQVSVQLTLPEGSEKRGLSERLQARLEARGYAVDVDVR